MADWKKRGETWTKIYNYKKASGGYGQKRFSFPGMTRRQAEKEYAKLITEFEDSINVRHNLTLKKLLALWLDHKKHNISYRTLQDYSKMVKYHSTSELANVAISELSMHQIQKYIDSMSASKLAAKTIRQRYLTIHQALEYAVRSEFIKSNPSKYVSLPKARKPEIEVIPNDKLSEIIAEVNNSLYRVPLLILFNTAMRRGEVCALQWQDIDFDKRIITVSKSLYLFQSKWTVKQTKSYKSRHISMNDLLYELLIQEYNNRKSDTWVCPSIVSEVLSPNTLYKNYSIIAKKFGVSTKLHDIRHTVITMMIQNNINFKIVSEIAGHSSIQMTLDRYTHIKTDAQKEAVAILGQKIGQKNN